MFKGGSADIPQNASRVEDFARRLQGKYEVRINDNIEALCSSAGVVSLETEPCIEFSTSA